MSISPGAAASPEGGALENFSCGTSQPVPTDLTVLLAMGQKWYLTVPQGKLGVGGKNM